MLMINVTCLLKNNENLDTRKTNLILQSIIFWNFSYMRLCYFEIDEVYK